MNKPIIHYFGKVKKFFVRFAPRCGVYASTGRGDLCAYEARDKYHRLRAMGNAQAPISFPFVLAKRERNGRLTGQRKGKALGG